MELSDLGRPNFFWRKDYPRNIYFSKVRNRNTRKKGGICSKLTVAPEQFVQCSSGEGCTIDLKVPQIPNAAMYKTVSVFFRFFFIFDGDNFFI